MRSTEYLHRIIKAGAAGVLLAAASQAGATQLLLPINSSSSTLKTQLKVTLITTSTSADSVPVSGFLLIDVDTNSAPGLISTRNFDIHAVRSLNFVNTVLWVAKVNTTVGNVQVYDGYPGPQAEHFPESAGKFTLQNLAFLVKGVASYSGATSGSRDLYSPTPRALSSISGNWQITNGTHYVHVDFTFSFAEITISTPIGNGKVNISGTGSLNAVAPPNAPPPPTPILSGGPEGGNLMIRWPSSLWPNPAAATTPVGYWPYRTTDLTSPAAWEREPAAVSDDGNWSTLILPMDVPQRFYRLEWK
jgi:hypothetical protein